MERLINEQNLTQYAYNHTSPESYLLHKLRLYTKNHLPDKSQMLTSVCEGKLLKFLVAISRTIKILEIGTFTGHASLSMAEALPANGSIFTLERDYKAIAIAQKFIAQSPHAHKIKLIIGEALETLPNIDEQFDLIFIDANKKSYAKYYELALNKLKLGGIIILDNMLWKGEVYATHKSSIGRYLDQLNYTITHDPRVENILLTINDGWQIVRKIK